MTPSLPLSNVQPPPSKALLSAICAQAIWGLFPLYWKQVSSVDALEVLMHRNLWCFVFLLGVVLISRRSAGIWQLLKMPKQVLLLACGALLIALNWGVYIWAVGHGQVVEASMGYFLAPLVSLLLARLVLFERLRTWQSMAIVLAAVGVLIRISMSPSLPWIALVLAVSFSLYGLTRKVGRAGPISGLFIETLLLLPCALGWLLWYGYNDALTASGQSLGIVSLLLLGGVVTAVPLLLFGKGAKELPLGLVGILIYITPSIQFLLGWLWYNEQVSPLSWLAFSLIWAGLALYSFEHHVHRRSVGKVPENVSR